LLLADIANECTGNSYEIENIGSIDAQIVFLQGREIRVTEEVAAEE